ncbi:MAG: hypothetical protein ACP5I8_13555 [Phycisphaerae bacterium]
MGKTKRYPLIIMLLISVICADGRATSITNSHATIARQRAQLRKSRLRFRDDPAIKILNPYYIRIATAVVTDNSTDLAKLAAKMQAFADDKSRPFLWFPATRARTFCLARLKDEDAFVACFAELCHAQGNIHNQNKLLKFIPPVLAWLGKHKKSAWVEQAVAAGLTASGPQPTKLYMYLLNLRLAEMRDPNHRVQLIEKAIGQAKVAVINAGKIPPPNPAKPPVGSGGGNGNAGNTPMALTLGFPHLKQYKSALEQLRYLRVLNLFYMLKLRKLQVAVGAYLSHYGSHGPHSAEVFYRMADALNVDYGFARTPQQKAAVVQAGDIIGNWYPKFENLPGPWQKQIQAALAKWQSMKASAVRR